MKKKQILIVVILALAGVVSLVAVRFLPTLKVNVPQYRPIGELVQLNQGWTDAQQYRFYHTAQGTRLLPYDWFMSLEQPCLSLMRCDLFAESTYLQRFGFLPSKPDQELNPGGLPIGFAYQKDFYDPENKQTYPVVGLTCAACHTGVIEYDKYAVRIDGAPALIELSQFQKALGLSLVLTKYVPGRYGRFEKRVLGDAAPDPQRRAALKSSFERLLEVAAAEKKAADERSIYVNMAGFARTDALARIGNQVFGVDMRREDNLSPSSAPVRFPQIWDASWFNWVQYNSSIADPLIRNIGESLGVRAAAKLYGEDAGQYDTSVNIDGLKKLEDLLSGPAPFEGLSSPKWPDVFPPLNREKVARGAQLYRQLCEGCHRPPVDVLRADLAAERPKYWWQNRHGKRFLIVKDVDLDFIGTDPQEAADFMERKADSGALGKGIVSAAVGLNLVTGGIRDRFFDKMAFSPEQRLEWSGYRDSADEAVRAGAYYKARPLNGIWAVAPYLHNGSVPTLYDLLSPPEQRPKEFWLASRRFDPVKVGYDGARIEGGYLYDTGKKGNRNTGHEFKEGQRGKGVIGPALTEDDRWSLIEYLKSL
jgi:hypothetical protein